MIIYIDNSLIMVVDILIGYKWIIICFYSLLLFIT